MFGEFMMCEYWLMVGFGLFFVSLFYNILLKRELRLNTKGDLELIKSAYFNPITHLPNEENIKFVLHEYIERAKRHQKRFLVASICVESLPQSEIVGLSHLLVESLRDEDVVGHLSQEQFVILFNEYLSAENEAVLMQRLQQSIALQSSVEVNIVTLEYPKDASSATELLEMLKSATKK